ncbi:MAG: hypothetical protein PHQ95_00035 [Candidatus Gracilibacteria bacterium]|nr:hypothetical protein [Candidatus Gracilibacteria bacterium]
MNMLNNKKEPCIGTQVEILEQFFFAPRTIKEIYLLSNFTQDMVPGLRKFIPFFTKRDTEQILACTNPKDCLSMVAGIIHRIQGEQSVIYSRNEVSRTKVERILFLQQE